MAEINVLDSSIFNRIAAGEVVENAASIVKELVENSIDANAKTITIEIASGGNKLIKVSDDGKGISKADMPIAFLPHATSKIKSLSDLERIMTLGFRGEALPSICSVAKVTMLSKQKDDVLGYCQVYENGRLLNEYEVGAANGTTVTVENLFDNLPARKKFLKKDSIEAARISDYVQKLVLANPNIVFKFINDGNVVFHSSGKDIESAIYTIYGENINNLTPVHSTMSDIVLNGYVSKPTFSKHNKTFQTLIVNGRVVENEEISYCVFLCYQEYLMKRQYPMYVLYLSVPLDMIDVNVHPNKLQVKFSDFTRIKNCIMGAVKKSVNLEILSPKSIETFDIPFVNPVQVTEQAVTKASNRVNSDVLFKQNNEVKSDFFSSTFDSKPYKNNEFILKEQHNRLVQKANNPFEKLNQQRNENNDENNKEQANMGLEPELIVSGKIFNTYIILQKADVVYLVDQHAAHERILYDKFISQIESKQTIIQDLLLPYVFSVTASEHELIMEALPIINECGFCLSEFGLKAFSLSSVPLVCSDINLMEFVSMLIEQLKAGALKKTNFIKDSLAQTACKAAVKGRDDLSKNQIELLVRQIEENAKALLCPHGRPIIIKISRKEIERWFKRIV